MPHQSSSTPSRFLIGLLLTILSFVGTGQAAWAARDGDRTGYFIEFLARPTQYVADHAFIQLGTIGPGGAAHVNEVVGFYPRDFPRINFSTSLFNAPGVIMRLPEDSSRHATARYRLMVDAVTYRKALTHAARMRRTWTRYDLFTRNCNAVFFEFAARLGLHIRHDMLAQPGNIIADIREAHGGGVLRVWRAGAGKR